MYSKSQLAIKWFQYYIRAYSGSGHGIHSPFVYELVREVFNDEREYYAYKLIETVKKNLLDDNRILEVDDPGAGSRKKGRTSKKLGVIVRTSVSEQKFGRLLFRLANFYHAKQIIELGTSVGISASYLASADPQSRVVTAEGSSAIAKIATETFQKLKLDNIIQVTGNFDEVLPNMIISHPPADLIFIDGNHRKKPLLDYFEKCIQKISASAMIIIHDIHWSREMEEAWDIIQQDPRVKMSIDIFSAGLVFFREEFLIKQQFIVRF